MASLEDWRPDIEARINTRTEYVDMKLQKILDKIEVFEASCKEQFNSCAYNHKLNDKRNKEINDTLQLNAVDR